MFDRWLRDPHPNVVMIMINTIDSPTGPKTEPCTVLECMYGDVRPPAYVNESASHYNLYSVFVGTQLALHGLPNKKSTERICKRIPIMNHDKPEVTTSNATIQLETRKAYDTDHSSQMPQEACQKILLQQAVFANTISCHQCGQVL